MARLARVVVEGVPHHVTHRGKRRGDIFFFDDDRRSYLWELSQAAERFRPRIRGRCDAPGAGRDRAHAAAAANPIAPRRIKTSLSCFDKYKWSNVPEFPPALTMIRGHNIMKQLCFIILTMIMSGCSAGNQDDVSFINMLTGIPENKVHVLDKYDEGRGLLDLASLDYKVRIDPIALNNMMQKNDIITLDYWEALREGVMGKYRFMKDEDVYDKAKSNNFIYAYKYSLGMRGKPMTTMVVDVRSSPTLIIYIRTKSEFKLKYLGKINDKIIMP